MNMDRTDLELIQQTVQYYIDGLYHSCCFVVCHYVLSHEQNLHHVDYLMLANHYVVFVSVYAHLLDCAYGCDDDDADAHCCSAGIAPGLVVVDHRAEVLLDILRL